MAKFQAHVAIAMGESGVPDIETYAYADQVGMGPTSLLTVEVKFVVGITLGDDLGLRMFVFFILRSVRLPIGTAVQAHHATSSWEGKRPSRFRANIICERSIEPSVD